MDVLQSKTTYIFPSWKHINIMHFLPANFGLQEYGSVQTTSTTTEKTHEA